MCQNNLFFLPFALLKLHVKVGWVVGWGVSSLTASITGLMNPPTDHKDDWWVRQFSMREWRWENRHGDNERIAPSSLPPYSSSAFLQSRGLLVKLHLCRCINKKLIVMHFDYFHHSDERERVFLSNFPPFTNIYAVLQICNEVWDCHCMW